MAKTNKNLNNFFNTHKFLGSFKSYEDIPFSSIRNECCFIGRSNVGKSSLINAITKGTDAQAEVTVRLIEDGRSVNGQAADTDTMVAAARAYIGALNKLIIKREKKALMNNSVSKQ